MAQKWQFQTYALPLFDLQCLDIANNIKPILLIWDTANKMRKIMKRKRAKIEGKGNSLAER